MEDNARELFTLDDIADRLRLSRPSLYRLIDAGALGSVKIGRSRRITRRQLTDFLDRVEAGGGLAVPSVSATDR